MAIAMDFPIGSAQVVARVRDILAELPQQLIASSDQFGDYDCLWRIEIRSTCDRVLNHHDAVLLLMGHGLDEPAIALSRSIHESYFRLQFLVDNEHELPSWTRWQMRRDFFACKDTLDFDENLDTRIRQHMQQVVGIVERLLGGQPNNRKNHWKQSKEILDAVTGEWTDGQRKRLRRLLVEIPSTYVHIRGTAVPRPPPEWIIRTTEISVLSTIQQAMEKCLERHLLPQKISAEASEIAKLCENLLEPE